MKKNHYIVPVTEEFTLLAQAVMQAASPGVDYTPGDELEGD